MMSRTSFVFAVLAVGVLCSAAPDSLAAPSAAAALTRHSPQEMWLAKKATGNFACRVNSARVTTDSPGSLENGNIVKPDDLLESFTNMATLEWGHVSQLSFASMDGRNDEKVLATPGGDMGEFITAIHALAKSSGQNPTPEEIGVAFEKYIKIMSREKFFYETDERAYNRLKMAAGCRNLHIADMGGMKRKKEALLQHVAMPDHIGDPYIRFMANNATSLDLNPEFIHSCLAAYHNLLWTSPSPYAEKLCYQMFKGPHREAALVNIKLPQYCVDQGLAPMVSQQLACPAPVFLHHGDVVKLFRRELVASLTAGNDNVDPRDVLATYNMLAESTLEKFWASVGRGLPSYTVEFASNSPLLQEPRNATSL